MALFVVGLTSVSNYARKSAVFQEKISEYFACESCGHNPADPACNREHFGKLISVVPAILVQILAGTLPLANLVFVVSFQDLKNVLSRACSTVAKRITLRDRA